MVQHAGGAELRLSRAHPKSAPKLPAAFVGDMVAGFEQDQLAVARTGAEDIIQPDSMADDIDRSFERRLNPPKCVN
jgi:hypothetical protein